MSYPSGKIVRSFRTVAVCTLIGLLWSVSASEARTQDFWPSELNSVFFERQSAVINEEAAAALDENTELALDESLQDSLCLRVEGWASRTERFSSTVADARAQAVAAAYEDAGIAPDRIVLLTSFCSQWDPGLMCFRADTIPVRCE